jgi:uncharacterized Ntn-hydrolase superfamily protein
VGNAVPAAVANLGAVATQADANVAFKGLALAYLDEGASAGAALHRLLEEDVKREERQVGIVDAEGNAATHTGRNCFDWAGGLLGDGVAIQGNILAGSHVVEAMMEAWEDSDPDAPLARRLLAALQAGDEAGGDKRGRQSAALLVVKDGAGYGGNDDVAVDLRVDDHAAPCTELERLLTLNDLFLTASEESEKVEVTPELAAELVERARAAGHRDLHDWVGTENYEMRVAEDGSWIDRRVLEILRREKGGSA